MNVLFCVLLVSEETLRFLINPLLQVTHLYEELRVCRLVGHWFLSVNSIRFIGHLDLFFFSLQDLLLCGVIEEVSLGYLTLWGVSSLYNMFKHIWFRTLLSQILVDAKGSEIRCSLIRFGCLDLSPLRHKFVQRIIDLREVQVLPVGERFVVSSHLVEVRSAGKS